MYREILIPTEQNHIVILPEEMYGKRVEIIAFEILEDKQEAKPKQNFLDDIDTIPDFPSVEKIRKEAWPEKW